MKKENKVIKMILTMALVLLMFAGCTNEVEPVVTEEPDKAVAMTAIEVPVAPGSSKMETKSISRRDDGLDKSQLSVTALVNVSSDVESVAALVKCAESNSVAYAQNIQRDDYNTMEDILVEYFINALLTAEQSRAEGTRDIAQHTTTDDGTEASGDIKTTPNAKHTYEGVELYLGDFSFYQELDLSIINLERVCFKCELIAQRLGWTTCWNIDLTEERFSFSMYYMG